MPYGSRSSSKFLHTLRFFKFLILPLRQDVRCKEKGAIEASTVAAGLAERRKHLSKSIRDLRDVQKVYMPGLSHLLDNEDSQLDVHPELFKLMLPSQLSPGDRKSWCLPGLSTTEARFRYAQADDALAEIRRLRCLYQGLSDQNKKHINTTQHTVTRGRGVLERYKTRISRAATLYRHARRALVILDPDGEVTGWMSRFLELAEADIRGPGREDNEPSEGRTVSSWIWLVPTSSLPPNEPRPNDTSDANASNFEDEADLSNRAASGEEVAISTRAHWARCQARAERYEEEAELTLEEMRWTLEFFKWKSRWWLTIQDLRVQLASPPDPQVEHGLRAYAHRQASIYSSLVGTYANHWRKFLVDNSLGSEWLGSYLTTPCPAAEFVLAEAEDVSLEGDEDVSSEGDEDEPDSEGPADPDFEEMFADF